MKTAVLLTKHRKSQQLAPVFYEMGIELVEINFFNTDQLGTFSGEIQRKLSPNDAALEKAKKAIELTGLNVGVGSEGSFDSGPMAGIFNWNKEIICLYQMEPELVIYASAEGPTPLRSLKADSIDTLRLILKDFVGQRWIIRCADGVLKGLTDSEVIELHQPSFTGWPITLEPDLRAMYSPLRQIMITKAALNLSERLQSKCPNCNMVDFWPDTKEFGPPCKQCASPTNELKALISCCKSCGYSQSKIKNEIGDILYCPYCNP